MMDWLQDVENKFGHYEELQNIKTDKKHCSLEINFCDGIPQNCNLKRHLIDKKINE